MKKILIVFDDLLLKKQEQQLKLIINPLCKSELYYTTYETPSIQLIFRIKYIGNILSHISYWLLSLKYALNLFFGKKYQRCENKLFINPIVGAFYCLLNETFGRKSSITVTGFLFSPKKNKFYYQIRKQFVLYCYRHVTNIVVYSNNEKEYYAKLFPRLANKFIFVQYGKDYPLAQEIEISKPYIFSGGGSNRDYKTLSSAMKEINNIRCVVATRPVFIDERLVPVSMNIKYNITIDAFGSWIKASDFFILPLINTQLSAGHMALLEAMKNGKIIIVSDIPAIRDYVDEKHVIFCAPGSVEDLRKKILYVINNKKEKELTELAQSAYERYSSHFTFKSLLKRLCEVSLR